MDGVVAQLVEHHNGIVGVRSSNLLGSTIQFRPLMLMNSMLTGFFLPAIKSISPDYLFLWPIEASPLPELPGEEFVFRGLLPRGEPKVTEHLPAAHELGVEKSAAFG